MVKRYEPRSMCDLPAHEEMREVDFGDYVTFEDYEKCRKQLLEFVGACEQYNEYAHWRGNIAKDEEILENVLHMRNAIRDVRKEFSEETE